MSDTKLRDLERRWKETGTVEDEAAYLLERVRVGELTRERLELAAYCGHEGAVRSVGPSNVRSDQFSLERLMIDFAKPASVWVALALARFLVATWESEFGSARTEARHTLLPLEEWVSCPCRVHLKQVRTHARGLGAIPLNWARLGATTTFHPAGWVPCAAWVLLAPNVDMTRQNLQSLQRACEATPESLSLRSHTSQTVAKLALH